MPDGPMELHIVVVALPAETDEVFARLGSDVGVELQVDHSKVGDQPDVTFGT